MSSTPNDFERLRSSRRRWPVGVVIAAVMALGAFVVATVSSADPIYDPNKVVPNAAGVSAAQAQSSDDCTTAVFLAQEQDLWHFVVPRETVRTNGESYRLTAEITAVIIQWQGGSLQRYTGTDDYDQGNAGANLFWAYTEPGRTIEQAWLEYTVTRDDGQPATETYLTMPHVLSHACAADGGEPKPPTISIDSDARYDMLYDLVYDWTIEKSVDAAGLTAVGNTPFVLDYTVQATRAETATPGNWRIVDGSMVVNGTVVVTNAALADISATTPGGNCIVVDDAITTDNTYLYECVIVDEPMVGSASGLSGTDVTITGTVTTSAGTATDTVDIPWGEPRTLILADVVHATAYIVDGERRSDTSSGPLSLTYRVEWLPTACPEQRVNVAELFDGVTDEKLGVDDTLVITGCAPVTGFTIGYWGNRIGAPQVVAAFPALRAQYPALADIPITNEASVRNYFTRASCSGTCTTMFLAQALATAMNARTGSFADQTVSFGGECKTVDEWLDLALRTAIPTDRDTRVAYKSLFDSLNNSRAVRCASVS
jgi:hypothetical protein